MGDSGGTTPREALQGTEIDNDAESAHSDPGKRLRDIRRQHGLSQQAFADRLGTTQKKISELERNIGDMDCGFLQRLYKYFHEEPQYVLLGRSEQSGVLEFYPEFKPKRPYRPSLYNRMMLMPEDFRHCFVEQLIEQTWDMAVKRGWVTPQQVEQINKLEQVTRQKDNDNDNDYDKGDSE